MLELMSNGFKFTAVAKHEVSVLEWPGNAPTAGSICTKNPQDHRLVGALIDRDQGQWFVSMVRDPRDIVCSRHGLRPEVFWANLRQWRAWLDNTRTYRQHPRLVEVRYEELVKRPDEVQRQIADRMPFLSPAVPFSRFHEFATPSRQSLEAIRDVRPINDASVGRWRNNPARVAGQIEIHGPIADDLIELGYETDHAWMSQLEGIEPDTRPGHWPEFMPEEYVAKYQRRQKEMLQAYLAARNL